MCGALAGKDDARAVPSGEASRSRKAEQDSGDAHKEAVQALDQESSAGTGSEKCSLSGLAIVRVLGH